MNLPVREPRSMAAPAVNRRAATLGPTSTTALPAVLRDYLMLTKPRAIVPHLITAASAMFLAVRGTPPLRTLVLTLLGGALVAAASHTLNCYLDRDVDGRMARTRSRPLPAGRITPQQALTFGVLLGALGLLILGRFVGWAATVLAFVALVYYVFAYTLFLKWRAPWNVLVGSGVGGITPLIGWVAATGRLTATPFLLAGIIILWTMPHFWSLAIFRRSDYEHAGVKPLPSRRVIPATIVCSVLLVAVSLLLAPAAGLGAFYVVAASVLGALFLVLALRMSRDERELLLPAKRFYSYSIVYVALLFIAMIVSEMPVAGGRS